MRIVTWRNDYYQNGRVLVEEEQDIVYLTGSRQTDPARTDTTTRTSTPSEASATESVAVFQFDPILLFRFSALTLNSHRIHYDLPYTKDVERHRSLVVQGPLLALLMMSYAAPDPDRVASVSFRAQAPVFVDDTVHLRTVHSHSQVDDEATGSLNLRLVHPDGHVAMTMSITTG